jgi:succinate dehydrogenase/fumarate reductase cytochrome b subunit
MEVPGILGILVLIADIYAILKIVKSSVSDGKKALWIVIVLLLPVLGVIIWYLMGPNGSK